MNDIPEKKHQICTHEMNRWQCAMQRMLGEYLHTIVMGERQ